MALHCSSRATHRGARLLPAVVFERQERKEVEQHRKAHQEAKTCTARGTQKADMSPGETCSWVTLFTTTVAATMATLLRLEW